MSEISLILVLQFKTSKIINDMTKIIKNLRKTPLSVEFFDLCSRNALKGQPAHSPGQRPGLWERGKFALKVQKNGVLVKLLPFQVGCSKFI